MDGAWEEGTTLQLGEGHGRLTCAELVVCEAESESKGLCSLFIVSIQELVCYFGVVNVLVLLVAALGFLLKVLVMRVLTLMYELRRRRVQ